MKIAYVYPWDVVGDLAAPERLAGLGVDAVAVAAAYHSVRAATPYHPAHRVLDARHAAFYLPVRQAAWGRVVPPNPSWTAPDSFRQARDALRAAGLRVHAWTVLTHSGRLGAEHPGLAVRNAFGDAYPYALCPAHEDVAEYCERLVTEVVSVGEPDGLILEACGPLGFPHASLHEKTQGADWSQTAQRLLSLCFCTACAPRYPAGVRALVRTGVDGSPASMADALEDHGDAVRELRTGLAASLRRRVVTAAREVRADLPIALHANPDPWAAGAFSALPAGDASLDTVVAMCWGGVDEAVAALRRLSATATAGQRIGAYALCLPPQPADAARLAESFTAYTEAGADELHLYHAGLASPQRLAALTEALPTWDGAKD